MNQRGYLEVIDPFYEISSSTQNGSFWWVLVNYSDIPCLLQPNLRGDAFRVVNLQPDEMFKENDNLALYRYHKIGLYEKPLFIRAKARPCVILELNFILPDEIIDSITGPIRHLKRKPFLAVPIYSIASSTEEIRQIPQAFKVLSLYMQTNHLFYCPLPPIDIIRGTSGLRGLHNLEGIARLDRMFITFEDPKIIKKTNLKLSNDALTLLYYLIANFLNWELSDQEKADYESLKLLLTEEFESKGINRIVLEGLAS